MDTTLLSDSDLLQTIRDLVVRGDALTSELVAHLAELEARRLYLPLGYSSLFSYCTEALHFSEQAAYDRIQVARLVPRFPRVLTLLSQGALHLAAVLLLSKHLTVENEAELLAAATHKSKRAVEKLLAARFPQPPVPAKIRKLPTRPPAPTPSPPAAPRPAQLLPLSATYYRVQFTASDACHDKLRRAQDLLRHAIPNGDPAAIFERALDALLASLEKKKLAATTRPRPARPPTPGSRHIPASVRRAVWERDGARCTFTAPDGRRCAETARLELHHRIPYARGGPASEANITLLCQRHNGLEAERDFGQARPP